MSRSKTVLSTTNPRQKLLTPKYPIKPSNLNQNNMIANNFGTSHQLQGQFNKSSVQNGLKKQNQDFIISQSKQLYPDREISVKTTMQNQKLMCDGCSTVKLNCQLLECKHKICSLCLTQSNQKCPKDACRQIAQRQYAIQEQMKAQNTCQFCKKNIQNDQIYSFQDCGCKICYSCVKIHHKQIILSCICLKCQRKFNLDAYKSFAKDKVQYCSLCNANIDNDEFYQNYHCKHSYCLNCIKSADPNSSRCLGIGCNAYLSISFKDFQKNYLSKGIQRCNVCEKPIDNDEFCENYYCKHIYCLNCMKQANSSLYQTQCLVNQCRAQISLSQFKETLNNFERKKQLQSNTMQALLQKERECSFCQKESKFIFKNKYCSHQYCYDCVSNKDPSACFVKYCLKSINYSELSQFKKEVEDKLPKNICSVCQKQSDYLYENYPSCKHRYCYYCITKSEYLINCLISKCGCSINQQKLDEFYMNEQNRLLNTKLNILELECGNCRNINMVQFENSIEYFKCSKCKTHNCYEHFQKKEKCFCFCPKCDRKTESHQNKIVKICQNCFYFYCDICKYQGRSGRPELIESEISQHNCCKAKEESKNGETETYNNDTLNQSLTTNDTKPNDNSITQKNKSLEITCKQCLKKVVIDEQQNKGSLKCLSCHSLMCYEHRDQKDCYCYCKFCKQKTNIVEGTQFLACSSCFSIFCSQCKYEKQGFTKYSQEQLIKKHQCQELSSPQSKQSSLHNNISNKNEQTQNILKPIPAEIQKQDIKIKQEKLQCLFKCLNNCNCQQEYCSVCLCTIPNIDNLNLYCQQHYLCLNCIILNPKDSCVFCRQIVSLPKKKESQKSFTVYTINQNLDQYQPMRAVDYLSQSNLQQNVLSSVANYTKLSNSTYNYTKPISQYSLRK